MKLAISISLIATGIFLLHPLHSEAVLYISHRGDLMLTLFILLGGVALLSSSWLGRLLAIPLYGLAILSKETAVVGVGLFALLAVRQWELGMKWVWVGLGCLIPGVWVTHLMLTTSAYSLGNYVSPTAQLEYLATQATALWTYTVRTILMFGFSVDHDFELIPLGIKYGLGVLLILAVMVLACRILMLRQRIDLVTLGCAWVAVSLVPRFVFRIPEFLNEHQMYLPMVGYALALAFIIDLSLSPRSPSVTLQGVDL